MATEKRLIDANHIVKVAEHAYKEWNLAMAAADGQRQINQVYKMKELCKAVKAVADAAPTVDAVEVVRCKDCKYINREIYAKGYGCLCNAHSCGREGHKRYLYVEDDDFCSYGERRTDEKT